ncbi:PREDICTED: CBP80/20-dependent translation initiation factor [Chrysochloris asiatica]|uniref:CBP80/20-dependent translation initiation factor n=1 Tax=Chrysochloris asiatica TaxID=185453 RepID=A0A9B0T0W6_CHRAS|nr:PREDICTED: CBP80/20-dependent translation initiation factor [Chrysochloris asiatica]
MENSSAASASSEAGSSRSQEIEELERFIDSYVLEYQVQGLLADKTEGDGESKKTPSHISQWTADCSEPLVSSCSFSRGRAPPQQNGSRDNSLDMLGTDIWAANTFDSFSGATWDLQPEKLDFTQFHRKLRHAPKQPLPHIDREGCGKGKLEDGEGINLNDIEKVLPAWQGYHPMPHEAEIAHSKKLFRRRRNDRRRQQRPPGGNKPQQHGDHPPGSAKHNRDHQKSYQGGSAPHPSGRPTHHGYSQNRRWHHNNMKHPPGDKGEAGTHRNAKETMTTEGPKLEEAPGDTGHGALETSRSPEVPALVAPDPLPLQQPGGPEAETKRKDCTLPERLGGQPRVTLLQSSKDRLRRRLKEKDEVTVETTSPQQNKMDKLIDILNSMRNNSSDVDAKLTTFMEEAQNSTNSEEMLGEIVRTIYQKAVSDRSFAFTAAKLCDKMALFMVEGTKFRSLLLNMLQGCLALLALCFDLSITYLRRARQAGQSPATTAGNLSYAERLQIAASQPCPGTASPDRAPLPAMAATRELARPGPVEKLSFVTEGKDLHPCFVVLQAVLAPPSPVGSEAEGDLAGPQGPVAVGGDREPARLEELCCVRGGGAELERADNRPAFCVCVSALAGDGGWSQAV